MIELYYQHHVDFSSFCRFLRLKMRWLGRRVKLEKRMDLLLWSKHRTWVAFDEEDPRSHLVVSVVDIIESHQYILRKNGFLKTWNCLTKRAIRHTLFSHPKIQTHSQSYLGPTVRSTDNCSSLHVIMSVCEFLSMRMVCKNHYS